jgi:subtilase family protein
MAASQHAAGTVTRPPDTTGSRGRSKTPARSRRADPPPRSTPPSGAAADEGGTPPADFSVAAGRFPALLRVIQQWDRLVEGSALRLLTRLELLAFPEEDEFDAAGAVRLAVVRHGAGEAARVVSRVRAAMARLELAGVRIEPGYFFRPAGPAPAGPVDRWTVELTPPLRASVLTARQTLRLPPAALGADWVAGWPDTRGVALIDTGDQNASAQLTFSRYAGPRRESPADDHGHGTAAGSILRLAAGDARIDSYRVFAPNDLRAESGVVLNALSVAINSTRVQVVCFPQRAEIAIDDRGHQGTLEWILGQRVAEGQQTPVVVCAAGNDGPHAEMSYPAVAPGVIVSVGLDRAGVPAPYNCPAPAQCRPHVIEAFGGVAADPAVVLRRTGDRDRPYYGSSFAAATIAGAILATCG